jgi:hypothetical protein
MKSHYPSNSRSARPTITEATAFPVDFQLDFTNLPYHHRSDGRFSLLLRLIGSTHFPFHRRNDNCSNALPRVGSADLSCNRRNDHISNLLLRSVGSSFHHYRRNDSRSNRPPRSSPSPFTIIAETTIVPIDFPDQAIHLHCYRRNDNLSSSCPVASNEPFRQSPKRQPFQLIDNHGL